MIKRLMRVAAVALLTLVLVAATGQTAHQMLSMQDLVDNVAAGNFKWSGSAQTGSTLMVTEGTFVADISNNGSCTGPANRLIAYSEAVLCRVLLSTHTPILLNNTYSGGSFSSWTSDTPIYTAPCASGATAVGGLNTTDQDGDAGFAQGGQAGSTLCNSSTPTTIGASQVFSTTGTPTSQTFSLWYNGETPTSVGDPVNCVGDTTVAYALTVRMNGTVEQTLSAPTLDGTWHQWTGTMTHMVSGSNTLDISVEVGGAHGSTTPPGCTPKTSASETFGIDHVVLSASY
jgi:hypothetical protein